MSAVNGYIPVHSKVRYFRWFSIIRHTENISIFQNASQWTISTFSAYINNQNSCCQMRFLSSKYTKMRLRLELCPGPQCGSLQHSSDPLAAGGEGLTVPFPKPHPLLSALRASSFRILDRGLKEVVHPWYIWL